MNFQDIEVSSIGEFSEAVLERSDTSVVWFRGQRDSEWKLEPSIARDNVAAEAEHMSIKRFKQNAVPFLKERPGNEWEWIFLMQHHRAPTRLLDWSESALVALYFALESPADAPDEADAVVWCLNPIGLNASAGHKRIYEKDILSFTVDVQLDNYLPENVGTEADLDPVAGIGPRNSARMVAQAGTFTITHSRHHPIDEVKNGEFVCRILINNQYKEKLRKELQALGVNELLLFPDLDRVAIHTGTLFK